MCYHQQMSNDVAKTAEHLMELARLNGTACATVSDGHLIFLRRDVLANLAKQQVSDDHDEVAVIFIKREDFTKKN